MKISACVIVKNEEKNIGRWLENAKAYADEIVVVDTGSEDATVKLALSGGARVEYFPWCDDFAAAKNYAIDQTHGQWITLLDADEFFAPQSLPYVRQQIELTARHPRLVGMVCSMVNIDSDRNNLRLGQEAQLRVFRKLHGLRYEGAIHEHLSNEFLLQHEVAFANELEIWHTGYASSVIKSKLERNLSLLLKEQSAGRAKGRSIYLMDCYAGLGDLDQAYQWGLQALADEDCFLGMETYVYTQLVLIMEKMQLPLEEILAVLELGKEKYPEAPAIWLTEGRLLTGAGYSLEAEECIRQGMRLYQVLQKSNDAKQKLAHLGAAERALRQMPLQGPGGD